MSEATQEQQLEQIELSISQAKEMVGKRDSLRKLLDNKEFNEIINVGFFEKEAARLVALRADPEMQNEQNQKAIDDQITAVGQLRLYLRTIFQQGAMAEKAIHDSEEERSAIMSQAE